MYLSYTDKLFSTCTEATFRFGKENERKLPHWLVRGEERKSVDDQHGNRTTFVDNRCLQPNGIVA